MVQVVIADKDKGNGSQDDSRRMPQYSRGLICGQRVSVSYIIVAVRHNSSTGNDFHKGGFVER